MIFGGERMRLSLHPRQMGGAIPIDAGLDGAAHAHQTDVAVEIRAVPGNRKQRSEVPTGGVAPQMRDHGIPVSHPVAAHLDRRRTVEPQMPGAEGFRVFGHHLSDHRWRAAVVRSGYNEMGRHEPFFEVPGPRNGRRPTDMR
ncbi:hypothetical protein GCM10023196_006670 [Actinoallomurus vinaceus]|uniref:Uncharacterized protein n=1 Tax=Actinoallomurus vinaceus TaxID=1080074 RepID=A0ABP8U3K9_9ACTN